MLTVEYYGRLAAAAGAEQHTVTEKNITNAAQLIEYIKNNYNIPDDFEGVAIAINNHLATPNQPLRDGDTVALLPPVSGG